VVEDDHISRAIDTQLKNMLFALEKVVFSCFGQLRNSGRGEIASDLFSDRIVLCGEVFFEPAALTRYLSRLTRFRFEASAGNPVPRGLRRILTSSPSQKKGYRALAEQIHEGERLYFARV
jgi:hypothetical protein